MVLCPVVVNWVFQRFACGKHKLKHTVYLLIQKGLVQFTILHGFNNVPVGNPVAGGHFKAEARAEALYPVVIGAPVGHNKAIKAPLPVEYIPEKMAVFTAVYAVYTIIAGHQRLDTALLHCHLEGRKINLAERALIHHRVHSHAVKLLGVDSVVLYTGIYAP